MKTDLGASKLIEKWCVENKIKFKIEHTPDLSETRCWTSAVKNASKMIDPQDYLLVSEPHYIWDVYEKFDKNSLTGGMCFVDVKIRSPDYDSNKSKSFGQLYSLLFCNKLQWIKKGNQCSYWDIADQKISYTKNNLDFLAMEIYYNQQLSRYPSENY